MLLGYIINFYYYLVNKINTNTSNIRRLNLNTNIKFFFLHNTHKIRINYLNYPKFKMAPSKSFFIFLLSAIFKNVNINV